MSDEKVVFISPRHEALSRHARTRLGDMLQRVQQRAVSQLQLAIAQSMDQADDSFFAMANKAESSALQDLYFDAMREIRLKRRGLEQRFHQELEQAFHRFSANPYVLAGRGTDQVSADNLSLVDNDELEEQLAFETMVGKARKLHSMPLAHLQVRLGWLAGDTKLAEVPTPLGPGTICEAFRKAARGLELDIRVRLVLLKLFDKQVMAGLGQLYHDLNDLLIEAGVLPELRATVSGRGSHAEASSSEQAPESRERSDALFDLVRQLLAQHQGGGPAVGASSPRYSMPEVLQALSAIQQQHAIAFLPGSPGQPLETLQVRSLLATRLPDLAGGNAPGAIGGLENDVLDVVGLLFDFILDDQNLLPPVKVVLSRLQIPIIKVALLDRGFFNKRNHPARQLLNTLAQAGMEWSGDGGATHDRLLAEMERVVERVLTEYEEDVGLFGDLLQEFEAFLGDEQRRADLIEERTRQAEQGKARAAAARKRVQEELAERTDGHDLPEVVATLLEDGWSRLLSLTLLREGTACDAWQSELQTVTDLVWSVQPKITAEERDRLLRTIPRLLDSVRRGLESISYDPVALDRLFKGLEQAHLAALRARRIEPAKKPAPAPAPQAPEPERIPFDPEQLVRLQVGAWLELRGEDGVLRRAKLSARFPDDGGERLLFVNRNGIKVAERTLAQLGQELEQGDARLLDDRQLFDRTLEAVVTSLRDLTPPKG